MLTAPDGWPIWVSGSRPGLEHAVTCAGTYLDLLDPIDTIIAQGRFVPADMGYEGEDTRQVMPYTLEAVPKQTEGFMKRKKLPLSEAEKMTNALYARLRSHAEQGNARLKVTLGALRHVSPDPWRVGIFAAAALVLLHWEHVRTT